MTKSEDSMGGTTVTQTKIRTESQKNYTRTSSGRGGRGDRANRGNVRNNIRDSTEITKKYYRGEIEAFGYMIALNDEKL